MTVSGHDILKLRGLATTGDVPYCGMLFKLIIKEQIMTRYVCDVCGWLYDPAVGDPENGVTPETAFEDLPADWVCPECGASKDDFSPEQ